jgi:uncharacterized lipoprotein YmbA
MKSCLTLAALVILIGCSSSPLPRTYVLSAPADPVAGVHNEAGRPVVELATVSMPDYLDSSDILLRDGRNELKPSATGKWGERLSVGITHALEVSLGRRLPGILVTHTPMSGQPTRRLLVDVAAFDFQPDGRCVLTARWTVSGSDPQTVAIAEQGTFVTIAPTSAGAFADSAVVSAMAAAVDQLADRMAVSLRRAPARPRP